MKKHRITISLYEIGGRKDGAVTFIVVPSDYEDMEKFMGKFYMAIEKIWTQLGILQKNR